MCLTPNICLLKSCRGHHLMIGSNRRIGGISYEDIIKEGRRFKSEPKLRTAELYRVNQMNCPLINTSGIARCPNNFEQLATNKLDLHLVINKIK